GQNRWSMRTSLPQEWEVSVQELRFKLKRTDFGHLGIFPEQAPLWKWIGEKVATRKKPKVLNLFAYSGGATLAAAQAGAEVCHLDAAKGMVSWARENAELNGLGKAPIRWIVDDARKFLERALRRGEKYDAIILDPPTFGRGKSGECFKIEYHLPKMLDHCRALLSDRPLFVLLSCHTPGYTPTVVRQLLRERWYKGEIEAGEMTLDGEFVVPSGVFARWIG
nr:Ribosomal RNA large subunit methyltransferase K [Chlamydiota bacterium]